MVKFVSAHIIIRLAASFRSVQFESSTIPVHARRIVAMVLRFLNEEIWYTRSQQTHNAYNISRKSTCLGL